MPSGHAVAAYGSAGGNAQAVFQVLSGLEIAIGVQKRACPVCASSSGSRQSYKSCAQDGRVEGFLAAAGLGPGKPNSLGSRIETYNLDMNLLDGSGGIVAGGRVHDAWPVKWQVASSKATSDEIAVKTLEFP